MFEDYTNQIENWIDGLLSECSSSKLSCSKFNTEFSGYYSPGFLSAAFFVVVDELPLPRFLADENPVFKDFLEMDMNGITYKDTYFIKAEYVENLVLHFHELVHVIQWNLLGSKGFIERYLGELGVYGYDEAPLERMAYGLQAGYESRKVLNIESIVKESL